MQIVSLFTKQINTEKIRLFCTITVVLLTTTVSKVHIRSYGSKIQECRIKLEFKLNKCTNEIN